MNVCGFFLASLSLIDISGSSYHDVKWGAQNSADAKVYYNVIDTSGFPVVDADVYVGYYTDYPKLKTQKEMLKTDSEGRFVVAGNLNHRIGVSVDKDGWYRSFDCVELRKTKSDPAIVDGKWQPYGEKRTIVLKPYCNPQKMSGIYKYADITIPAFDKWLSYDFEKSSWLPPFGDGVTPDVLMRFTFKTGANRYFDFESTMEVSFTNTVYGGFYIKSKDEFSELKYAYKADTNQVFISSIKFSDNGSLDDKGKKYLADNEYMVFRTRTKVDEFGRILSAHYGKILGGWRFGERMHIMGYSFNSIPNDTNLEDIETCARSQQRRKHEKEMRSR